MELFCWALWVVICMILLWLFAQHLLVLPPVCNALCMIKLPHKASVLCVHGGGILAHIIFHHVNQCKVSCRRRVMAVYMHIYIWRIRRGKSHETILGFMSLTARWLKAAIAAFLIRPIQIAIIASHSNWVVLLKALNLNQIYYSNNLHRLTWTVLVCSWKMSLQ